MVQAADILAIARAELGYKETPANSNKTKYGAWFGLDGQPWCMMFVQWVFAQAGAAALLPVRTASCGAMMTTAKAQGMWVTSGYKTGDVVIFDFPGNTVKTDHVGIVDTVTASGVITIEGNTCVSNDANGGAVMRRTRASSLILGAVRPNYEEDSIDMISDKDIEGLTETQLVRLAERMQGALGKKAISDKLSPELAEAKALGITDGSNPNAFCTRAQAAAMIKRAVSK
jgi:hypothetical protein